MITFTEKFNENIFEYSFLYHIPDECYSNKRPQERTPFLSAYEYYGSNVELKNAHRDWRDINSGRIDPIISKYFMNDFGNNTFYLFFLWGLLNNKNKFSTLFSSSREDKIHDLISDGIFVLGNILWDYETIHDFGKIEDCGFSRSKYSYLIELSSFRALSLLGMLHQGASTDIVMYGCANQKKLYNNLRNSNQPNFTEVLENEDIFISLNIGNDMGYYDYLIIRSKVDLSLRISHVLRHLNGLRDNYLKEINNIKSVVEHCELLDSLFLEYETNLSML